MRAPAGTAKQKNLGHPDGPREAKKQDNKKNKNQKPKKGVGLFGEAARFGRTISPSSSRPAPCAAGRGAAGVGSGVRGRDAETLMKAEAPEGPGQRGAARCYCWRSSRPTSFPALIGKIPTLSERRPAKFRLVPPLVES